MPKKMSKKTTKKTSTKSYSKRQIDDALEFFKTHDEEMTTHFGALASLMKPMKLKLGGYQNTIQFKLSHDPSGSIKIEAGCREFTVSQAKEIYNWLKPVCDRTT